jgi:hypothetical protein
MTSCTGSYRREVYQSRELAGNRERGGVAYGIVLDTADPIRSHAFQCYSDIFLSYGAPLVLAGQVLCEYSPSITVMTRYPPGRGIIRMFFNAWSDLARLRAILKIK